MALGKYMQINNTLSSTTLNNYARNIGHLHKSISKLSSGKRINNAGADPSGLALSERLRSQVRNTAAAASNVENMLNYLKTSDSWMQKIHDLLGRMGELAITANDDTKSDIDKDVLQNEFKQMQDEISRITGHRGISPPNQGDTAGKFNGQILFQSDYYGNVYTQVGPDGGQIYTSEGIDLSDNRPESLARFGSSTSWLYLINSESTNAIGIGTDPSHDAGFAVDAAKAGIDLVSTRRAQVGAEIKRLEHALDGLRNYEENIVETESRIRDVDVAKETAEMSKYSILQQVGSAILAQVNQIPKSVLQLLGR